MTSEHINKIISTILSWCIDVMLLLSLLCIIGSKRGHGQRMWMM